MKTIKSIGILTSGGDCGGLNAVVKGAARMALAQGIRPYAILNGYAGLVNLGDGTIFDNQAASYAQAASDGRTSAGYPVELTEELLEEIDMMNAGSRIGNARVKISKVQDEDKYTRIKKALERYEIGALIISGGDDSGSVVVDLHRNGIPCVHVPKTMDLDLQTYSVGGDSAINNIARAVNSVRTTGMSHNRIVIVEVFGRYAGHTAFRGGCAADADCVLIPEVAIDFGVVYRHMKERFLKRLRRSRYLEATYTIVVAEGLMVRDGLMVDESQGSDAFGHKKMGGTGRYVREQLSALLTQDDDFKNAYRELGLFVANMNEQPEIRETVPGYLIRSGETTALDAVFGMDAGAGAVLLLQQGVFGVTVTGVDKGKVDYVKTEDAIAPRLVDLGMVSLYEEMGVCFGRNPEKLNIEFEPHSTAKWNYI